MNHRAREDHSCLQKSGRAELLTWKGRRHHTQGTQGTQGPDLKPQSISSPISSLKPINWAYLQEKRTLKGAVATKIHEGDEERENTSTSASVAVVTGIGLRKLSNDRFWNGQQRGHGTGKPWNRNLRPAGAVLKKLLHSISMKFAKIQDNVKFPQCKVSRGLGVNEAE